MRMIIASLLFLLSSDSISGENFSISYFGDMINNSGDIEATYNSSKVIFNVNGCSIAWKINDPFYVVKISEDELYAIKKDVYDKLATEYNNDDKITSMLLDEQGICSITVVNNT